MKAKTIGKRVAVGLMSASLLLSNMSVLAAETGAAQPGLESPGEENPVLDAGDLTDAGTPESDAAADENENEAGEAPGGGQEEPEKQETAPGEDAVGGESDGGADAGTREEPGSEADAPIEENETGAGEEPEDGETQETQETDEETEEDTQEEPEDAGAQTFSLNGLQIVRGDIAVDGDLSDWKNVTSRPSREAWASEWKVVCSEDGGTLFFAYTGDTSTEWDYSFASANHPFALEYADGTTDRDSTVSLTAYNGGANVKDSWYGDIAGANAAVINSAHGNNAGPYTAEFSVPVSFFHSMDFSLTFAGVTIRVEEIEQIDGNEVEPSAPPVYAGISIDGNYADWAAVAKTGTSCPNAAHPGCVSEVAAIYDGDWFYIYIKDGEGSNASGAGTHSNGKFAIYSDLGYESDIQLSTSPAVSGVDGAIVSYVGCEWEIGIPKDQLPKYEESLSFGFYLGEVLITDIVNLQEDSNNNLENLFNGVICDGQYEDWEDYGHATIEYDTPGSQEQHIDAKGALYSDGETLYGHVVTDAPDHLAEAGGEFIKGVTIAFNQKLSELQQNGAKRELSFFWMPVAVDAAGNINWTPKQEGYEEGTYKLYIASIDAWHVSTNINSLHETDLIYGELYMTIGKGGVDEMEFRMDLPMVAKKLGLDKTDLKEMAAQFIRIGNQWIFMAGTSTGPWTGVALCVITVGLAFWYRRKKNGTMEWVPAGA